jgi:hypothetical protein
VKTLRLLTPPVIQLSERIPGERPKWRAIVALEDIERAGKIGPDRCAAVPTYLRDGRKTLDVLDLMPEGAKKDRFMDKHGLGMVNVCYLPGGSCAGELSTL